MMQPFRIRSSIDGICLRISKIEHRGVRLTKRTTDIDVSIICGAKYGMGPA